MSDLNFGIFLSFPFGAFVQHWIATTRNDYEKMCVLCHSQYNNPKMTICRLAKRLPNYESIREIVDVINFGQKGFEAWWTSIY